MFTGLIQCVGVVTATEMAAGRLRLSIALPPENMMGITIGESIAIDGVCLTVVSVNDGVCQFDVVGETLKKTTLRTAKVEHPINAERALRAGDPMGGHFVTGHIDGLGRVEKIEREGGDLLFTFYAPPELLPEVAAKGSVAVNGISLTVLSTVPGGFTCTIIPHTLNATTLGDKTPGDLVNLETDVLAKYVRRAADAARGSKAPAVAPEAGAGSPRGKAE
ncbi:MAG: riboflavin synthase [Planctomycetes bacterium]|nr:riboflavin synthase [Planctomycetota bacterium]